MTINEAKTWSAPPGLWDLLESGPFDQALRAAILHSGLTLDRIRYRLSLQTIQVSVATLSHWQSGRSQPEKHESLVAIGQLEELLGVPAGSLTALLHAPRPRGRRRTRDQHAVAAHAVWPPQDNVSELLRGFDTGHDDALVRISHHDLVKIGPDRGERSLRVRQLLRSDQDGVDRTVAVYHVDEPSQAAPAVRALRHCRVGKTAFAAHTGYLVAEILFDRPLNRGDTIVIEYELICAPPYARSARFERALRHPVREYLLEIAFDPAALPVRCCQYVRSHVLQEQDRIRGLQLDPSHCVQLAKLDAAPGMHGIRWFWA